MVSPSSLIVAVSLQSGSLSEWSRPSHQVGTANCLPVNVNDSVPLIFDGFHTLIGFLARSSPVVLTTGQGILGV